MINGLTVKKIAIEISVVEVENEIVITCPDNHELSTTPDGIRILTLLPTDSSIRIMVDGKTQEDTKVMHGEIVEDATVKFQRVWINDILIENWAFAKLGRFDQHQQDHSTGFQIGPDLTFYSNGTFTLDLEEFFHRYHATLSQPLRESYDWIVNSHLGYIEPADRIKLQEIYEKICALKE